MTHFSIIYFIFVLNIKYSPREAYHLQCYQHYETNYPSEETIAGKDI